MENNIKGFVLAAGLGTRLLPLTKRLPKPLFPFGGPALIDLALWKLSESGMSHLAINTHYLSDTIASHIKEHCPVKNIHISHEPLLLGTGGCLPPLADWIGNDHVLIYNADIISDIDIKQMVHEHIKSKAFATMALLPESSSDKTPLYCHNSQIFGIGKKPDKPRNYSQHTFTGIHILSPEFLKLLPLTQPLHIIDIYNRALEMGAYIHGYTHNGFWHDMGIPKDYWAALTNFIDNYSHKLDKDLGISSLLTVMDMNLDFVFGASDNPNIIPPVIIPKNLSIPNSTKIGPYTICLPNVSIGKNVLIEHSLLLSGSDIKDGESISKVIILGEERVPI
jgi:mannose-1-phosphate guanylyltransferase